MNANLFLALAALAAAVAGFAALGLAMDRHWAGIHGRGAALPPALQRRLQLAGGSALALSLCCCLAGRATGQALVLWCGLLSAAAWLNVSVMTYAPQRAAQVGKLAACLALACGLAALALR